MKKVISALALALAVALIGVGVASAAPVPPTISLSSVGSRYTNTDIPIKGYLGGDDAPGATIKVQRLIGTTWTDQGSTASPGVTGPYAGKTQQVATAGTWKFRTQLLNGTTVLATSPEIAVVVKAGATAPPPPPPPSTTITGTITLSSVGSRYVGGSIPIKGSIGGTNIVGVSKDIVVQIETAPGNWAEAGHLHGFTGSGAYQLPTPLVAPLTAGTYKYRTLLYHQGSLLLAGSDVISVVVKATATAPPPPPPPNTGDPNTKPAPVTEERYLDGEKMCQTLTVKVAHQKRTNNWKWDATALKWVPDWTDWMTHHNTVRQATVADCVNLVPTLASDVLLPDIRIKQLNKCGAGDLAATNNTCFLIVNPAPNTPDFPALSGKKLLKFPVLTMNAGDGPAEVIANRASADETQWKAYQTFIRPNGERQSKVASNVNFYFAGDGHNHWHFTDFDDYWIEEVSGTRLRSAAKHGYCLLDNTSLSSMKGQPGVPAEPVYVEATTCGEGLPQGLTFLQGLSKGWGDTYPTSLPDQAIDITGLPNGRYRVGVKADAVGAVVEKNESNNTATIEITITNNAVAIHPETAQGGVL